MHTFMVIRSLDLTYSPRSANLTKNIRNKKGEGEKGGGGGTSNG